MQRLEPEPAALEAAEAGRRYHAAIEDEDWKAAVSIAMQGTFSTAVAIARSGGVEIELRAGASLLDQSRVFHAACETALNERGENALVNAARDAFKCISRAEASLMRAQSHPDKRSIHRLAVDFGGVGRADTILSIISSGVWSHYTGAIESLENLGAHRRGYVPEWEAQFLPLAISYCRSRAKVTLAELRRKAQTWARAEREKGNNPGLPGTDKGIDDGLKRMETSGQLIIPGRAGG